MRFFLLAVCLIGAIAVAQAQPPVPAKRVFDRGKEAYDKDDYKAAITDFKMAIAGYKPYEEAYYYLGASYHYGNLPTEAVTTFQQLEDLNPDYWPYYYYWWGRSLEELNEFEKAAVVYTKFLQKYDHEPNHISFHHQAMYRLRYVQESPALRAAPPKMKEPTNLGPGVNSQWGDYMPQSDPTGRTIYFTSYRMGGMMESAADTTEREDLWKIEKTDAGWSTPVLLPPPINSYRNDGAATFTGDGQTMVYGACGREGGIGSCDLYFASLEGTEWKTPVNMGDVVNSDKWDSQPTLSADGNLLIFTSDRQAGYGGSDLYMTRRNRFGEWGSPMNMGPEVNTPFSEYSPYLSSDGKTLYFSSNGLPGYGDSDVFVSVYEDNRWSDPVNMGAPLNSSGQDQYFTIGGSGEVGFFASNRTGGTGDLDLYAIDIPEAMRPQPTAVVSGIVTSAKDSNPLGAWVLVEDLESGELIATNKSNPVTGKYLVVLPAGRNYSVSANRDKFFFYSQQFDLPKDSRYQEITKNIALEPIEKGTKVVLNNVFFETGKAILTPESKLELVKAVDLMRNNRTMVIEVGGHTDNVGNAEANMTLSHERAMAVREFLVNAGITAERVSSKGYGQTGPVASNDTPEGRQANRRTEIIILEY